MTRAELVEGVRGGDRAKLARAITLIESTRDDHRALAQQVLTDLLPHTGDAIRVGLTGVPGVGKSTFIDGLGTQLTKTGHRVAVLAIDPSSTRTGGSILGDKTRMDRLSVDPNAYIRPSPTGGTLGGVARKTREAMLLCEAAGYDVMIIETVGVGQSEIIVADMVDTFVALMLPGAGDELQGIKRGLMECADIIAINKADLDQKRADRAAHEHRQALRYLKPREPNWTPRVRTCSATNEVGIKQVWQDVMAHRGALEIDDRLQNRRQSQALHWMWSLIDETLHRRLRSDPGVIQILGTTEAAVRGGELPATEGALRILAAFKPTSAPASF